MGTDQGRSRYCMAPDIEERIPYWRFDRDTALIGSGSGILCPGFPDFPSSHVPDVLGDHPVARR